MYAQDTPENPNGRGMRRFSIYLGLALLAAGLLVAVNEGGAASRFPRVLVPGSSATCTTPPTGFLFSQTKDGSTFQVCISRQGNINQISYPDTAAGHTQIAFDGYCLGDRNTSTLYSDYSPGSGVTSTGWGPATLTQTAGNILSMTRSSTDGKFQLTEFIKINFQPRSIFVGMTVKNTDPANVTHNVFVNREMAPAIDGNASDDQYNEFGINLNGDGKTGQASQSPGPDTDSLLFGPTQRSGRVFTAPVSDFRAVGGCGQYQTDFPGFVSGGNRFFGAFTNQGVFILAPNASVNVGKFVYRML
jgi:hypothetical protein